MSISMIDQLPFIKRCFIAAILYQLVLVQDGLAQRDTLRNFDKQIPVYAPRYESPGQWGYVLGQNHNYRQQFAEKYNVKGTRKVLAITAQLAGVYANEENFVEFNVYDVAPTGLTGKKLASVQKYYKDLKLDGKPYTVQLLTPVTVKDSFFVAFNVMDYMHGGYDGDTLGLYCAQPGTRPASDLGNFGRNAIQAHNHVIEDWKDFYSQNFSPIATHFAIFPVIEQDVVMGIEDQFPSFTLEAPYPNPAPFLLHVAYALHKRSDVEIRIVDQNGRTVLQKAHARQPAGKYTDPIDVSAIVSGKYLCVIETNHGTKTEHIFIQ